MRPHPSASKVTSTTVSPWATKPVLAGEQLVVELHVRARETRRPSGGRGTAGRSSSATCRDGLKGPGRVGAGGGGSQTAGPQESRRITPPASIPSLFRSN